MAIARIPGIPYALPPSAEASARVLGQPPRLIVIHDTGNPTATAENEASYAHTRAVSGATSAHAYVDTGGPLGSLRLDRQAWAAYSYANANGWHVEMCGMNAGAPDAVPPATIAHTARLVRQLCDLAGIPMVKLTPSQVAAGARGVCGHRDVTIGLGVGTHDDPGAKFDWTAFMQMVNATTPTKGAALMALSDQQQNDMWEWLALLVDPTTPPTGRPTERFHFPPLVMQAAKLVPGLVTQVTALTAAVQALAESINNAGGDLDTVAIFAKIDQAVADVNTQVEEATAAAVAAGQEARDAVGDLAEGGAEQVRADEDAGPVGG